MMIQKQMKGNTIAEAINVKRVSLELNSQPVMRGNSAGHSRVSMCYSANLKKRNDAVNAQRTIFDQPLQKSEVLIERSAVHCKTGSPVRTKIVRETRPLTVTKIGEGNKVIETRANLQSIEIQTKSLYKKDKPKKLKTDLLPNYDTITSKDLGLQMQDEYHPVMHSEPSSIIHSIVKTDSFRQTPSMNSNSYSLVHKAQPQTWPPKPENSRILTAPTVNMDPLLKSSKLLHKETYRTNLINFSEHFKNIEEKNSVFPSCRKMAISSVNKYYEICIEDIKNAELKRKCNKEGEKGDEMGEEKPIAGETVDSKNEGRIKHQKEINRKRIESAPAYKKSLTRFKNPNPEPANPKPKPKSFLTTNKLYRNEVEQNQIWLQIKNTIDEEQLLGYSLCTKKLLQQRSNTANISKKNMNGRYTLKKCNTDANANANVNWYEDQWGNRVMEVYGPVSAVKLGRNRSGKLEKSGVKGKMGVGQQEETIGAWDTPQNFETNNLNNEYNL